MTVLGSRLYQSRFFVSMTVTSGFDLTQIRIFAEFWTSTSEILTSGVEVVRI